MMVHIRNTKSDKFTLCGVLESKCLTIIANKKYIDVPINAKVCRRCEMKFSKDDKSLIIIE